MSDIDQPGPLSDLGRERIQQYREEKADRIDGGGWRDRVRYQLVLFAAFAQSIAVLTAALQVGVLAVQLTIPNVEQLAAVLLNLLFIASCIGVRRHLEDDWWFE